MPSYRSLKIADAIKRHATMIVQGELSDPRIDSVTVLHVLLSKDSSHAKIFFTTENPDPKTVEEALNKAAGYVRTQLAQALNLGYTPSLKFVFDPTYSEQSKIESIFDRLAAQRAQDES